MVAAAMVTPMAVIVARTTTSTLVAEAAAMVDVDGTPPSVSTVGPRDVCDQSVRCWLGTDQRWGRPSPALGE